MKTPIEAEGPWALLRAVLRPGRVLWGMDTVYQLLSAGPFPVHPWEGPRGDWSFRAWEQRYFRPSTRGSSPSPAHLAIESRRAEIQGDEYAELEALRISAILALNFLEDWHADRPEAGTDDEDHMERDGADLLGPNHRYQLRRARNDLHRWLREVMRRAGKRSDPYFELHRLRPAPADPGPADGPEDGRRSAKRRMLTLRARHAGPDAEHRFSDDPFVQEVLGFFLDRGAESRLTFLGARHAHLIEEVLLWLMDRYALDEARLFLQAYESEHAIASRTLGPERDRALRNRFRFHRLRLETLPRVLAATFVGQIAFGVSDEARGAFQALASQAWRGLLLGSVMLATFSALVGLEIRRRAPRRGDIPLRACKIGWMVFGVAYVMSLLVTAALRGCGIGDAPFSFLALFVNTTASMLVGYILQVLWDDKSITAEL